MVGRHHCFFLKKDPTKGVGFFFQECPADLCRLAFSFTYKTPWPICLGTGCRHNVCIPSLEREDPRCGVLHRGRLRNNSKHGCSLRALGEEEATTEGSFGQKVSPTFVRKRNLLFGSFAQRCGTLILFISPLKLFF